MPSARPRARKATKGLVFIGLDVGTDGTAVVACTRTTEGEPFSAPIPVPFGNKDTVPSTLSKDKSAILYTKVRGGKPDLYGRAAIDKCVGDPALESCLVRSFKLHAKDPSPDWEVADEAGVPLTREKVLTDWLNHIVPSVRDHFIAARPELKNSDFVWAATVPARSAEGMRETYKRLLHQAIGSGARLHIISEPIAAMLHCNKFVIANSESPLWDSPDPVLVVDIGGGTMDLTVFEWTEDMTAKQLAADDGSYDAGCQVDVFMKERVKERIGGDKVWDDFINFEKNPPRDMPTIEFTYLEMLISWEKHKFAFTGIEEARLTLPTALEHAMRKAGTFDKFVASQGNARRTIRLTPDDMKSCFDRVIDPICGHIDAVVVLGQDGKPRPLRKFLTGGLAGNRYFRDVMEDRYKYTLYDSLYSRDLAVGLGALDYSKDPGCIGNRILRRSYGINMWKPVDDFPSATEIKGKLRKQEKAGEKERETLLEVKDFDYMHGKKRVKRQCLYAFVPFAKMGEEVVLGEDITAPCNEVLPNTEDEREVTVYVASCHMVVDDITPWDMIPEELKDGHSAFSLPAASPGTKMHVALQFDVLDLTVKLRTPNDRSDEHYSVDDGT